AREKQQFVGRHVRSSVRPRLRGGRSARTPRAAWQGARHGRENRLQYTRRKTDRMTAAILFAFASAALLGSAVVTSQLGLRTVQPLSASAIGFPAFTLLLLLLSPILLAGEPVVWRGLPIFAAIGLFFPASLTLLAFASNRALGPVITSTLGNLAPLFSVALAVVLLHEPLRAMQAGGPLI